VFVIPLGALWLGQARAKTSEAARMGWIMSDLPLSPRAHLKYGVSLQQAGRLDDAAQEFRTALELGPQGESADYRLGQVLLDQNRPEEAVQHLQTAVNAEPRNADIHGEYAAALERLGRNGEAFTEYRTAVALSPKAARVHYNFGMFLAQQRRLDEAIPEFEQALKHNRNLPHAHYYLGRALFQRGDLHGAKTHYIETAQLDPTAPVHNSLGVIYMRLGQASQAIEEFNEALRLNPADADAAENLRFIRTGGGASTPR
jgi:Flp pilus assembly protein TadD